MPPVIIDIVTLVLILGMTYALASEGLWGAALQFFNALFAGIIAFNFYEPMAALVSSNISALTGFADAMSLLILFAVSLVLLRLTTDSIGPTMVRFPAPIYHIGRWTFGLLGACITMAILLLAFHTAPVHKKMFYGAFPYDKKPPFGMGLDWQWLGFFQYTTGYVFSRNSETNPADPFGEYGNARVFDPRGRWLIDHQNARPYGDGFVPDASSASDAGAGGAAGIPGAPGAAAVGGSPGPGIPGGTAGAAAGLAPTNAF